MEALITLYTRATGIEAEKLQMIEDIEAYLTAKEPNAPTYTIQYQKIRLSMFVKVILDEAYSSPLQENNYTYVKIVNKDNLTKPFYFFVKTLNWKSQSCIELDLVLDTLNSFKMGTDYTFSPKTIIQRQHKDRIEYKEEMDQFTNVSVNYTGGSGYEIFKDNKLYVYSFTNKNDLFTAQEYQDIDEYELNFDISNNNNRYLFFLYDRFHQKIIYGSENPQSEEYFEIHKVVSYEVYQQKYSDYVIVNSSYPVTNNSLVFIALNRDIAFVYEDTDYTAEDIYIAIKLKVPSGTQFPMTWFNNDHQEIVDVNPDTYLASIIFGSITINQIIFRKVDFMEEGINPTLYHNYRDEENRSLQDTYSLNSKWYLIYISDTDTPTAIKCYIANETGIPVIFNGVEYTANGFNSLDRTLSTIVKIIEYPYCPYEFYRSNGKIVIDGVKWGFNPALRWITLLDSDMDFVRDRLSTSMLSPNNNLILNQNNLNELISNRNDNLESKMFHSEFYLDKYVYDSFGFDYKYECIDINEWYELNKAELPNATINVTFKVSNTINSRFGFKFNDYITGDLTEKDYSPYLLVARNNEPPIYNSAYLDYIRSGYNFDVKNKNANNTKNWIMFAASLSGTILSTIGAVVTKGLTTPLVIASISGTIASASTLSNAIISTGQNERTISQKLHQLELQATNVSNADDLNIMNWYKGNRIHRAIYKVNSRVEKLLKDLFYYYGYKDNVSGIPNTNTRYWFNHLKCEPILEFSSINMTQEIEEELKGIMRNGFTIYHKQLVNSVPTWDIEQVRENWEVSMLPYLS